MTALTIKEKWKNFAFWHFVYEFGGDLEAHEVFDQLVSASPDDREQLVEFFEIETSSPWNDRLDANELVEMMLSLANEVQQIEEC